ncbi:MAG: transcriptional regulator [Pseudomonadota bacterium]
MARDQFSFDRFRLDLPDRRLLRDGEPVDLNNRYFDALALLLREQGQLVPKDRFMTEVWRGVPVTDEALTQCIRTLRRLLDDDAARPRFIETVPKHGYRFVGPVDEVALVAPQKDMPSTAALRRALAIAAAAAIGGGLAGVAGGLFYGFGVNAGAAPPAMGATSVLFVLLAINMLVGLLGGAGVGTGLAIADLMHANRLASSILGSAAGGLLTGAVAKLVGLDAFRLLLGQSPVQMTGAAEGAALGAAAGLATWLTYRNSSTLPRSAMWGGVICGSAGLLIVSLGGILLGGSLDSLLHGFPNARFPLGSIGAVFGEAGFGPVSRVITGAVEGFLFGACLTAAVQFARQAMGANAR